MKVYVVEVGCYEERYLSGVYASLEEALAAHPIPERREAGSGGWRESGLGWKNGLDWDDAARIYEYEVLGEPALTPQ